MKKVMMGTVLVSSLALGACAPAPDQVASSYVSPTVYQGRSCSSLTAERNQIVSQVNNLNQEQQKAATNDAVATGVALVLFWPAAFAIAATKDNATALSAGKGNYDAITQQMRTQGCRLPVEEVAEAAPAETNQKKRSWE